MDNNSLKDLFNIKNYSSYFGLVQSTAYILFITLILIWIFNQITPILLNSIYLLVVLFSIQLLHLLIWILVKVARSIPRVRKNKINIAFAIRINNENISLYTQIINNFKRNIKTLDGFNNFNIIELPKEIHFEDQIKAEKYITDEYINLLIWGDTEEGKVDNNNVTIYHLKFTYNFRVGALSNEDFLNNKVIFLNNIKNSIKGRKWDVIEAQSLPTLRVVSENLTEVSLYITARCLATFGFIRLGFEYCEKLFQLLSINKNKFPGFDSFKIMVKYTLLQLAEVLVSFHMSHTGNLEQSEKYANRILELDNKNLAAVSHLAVISWLKNNEEMAHQFARRARKIDPSNNINKFNDAFFAFMRDDFKKALTMYKKIDSIPSGTNILSIIEFLEKEYDRSNNIALLFAAGYLNTVFADSKRGKGLLKSFLLKVNNIKAQEKYKDLLEVVRRFLEGN